MTFLNFLKNFKLTVILKFNEFARTVETDKCSLSLTARFRGAIMGVGKGSELDREEC